MSGQSCATCPNLRWEANRYECRAWNLPAEPEGGCAIHGQSLDPDGYFTAYPPTGVARALAEAAVQRFVGGAPTWTWWGSAAEADAPLEPAAGDVLGDGDPPDWRGAEVHRG